MSTNYVAVLAQQIAEDAHLGQTDQAGAAYITHPARVAARVAGDTDAQAVAWLHDVVEDTSVSLQDLRSHGIPEPILHAVDALTRRDDEGDEYYTRVAANALALKVKHADLADNTDPKRLALLSADTRARLETKYAHARTMLASSAGRSL